MAMYSYKMLTAQEVRDLAPNAIAVVPLGAIEQHGKHLPVGTDLLICEHLVEKVLQQKADYADVCVLPPLPYTCSIEHNAHGGTVALGSVQVIEVLISIGEALIRAGFKKMLILCCHGGNEFIMEVASRELRTRGILSFCMHGSAGMRGETDPNDMHAGEGETSMMMSFGDAYVRKDRINPNAKESLAKCEALVNSSTRGTQAWVIDDVAIDGVVGDPTLADAAKGEKFVEMNAAEVEHILKEIAKIPVK